MGDVLKCLDSQVSKLKQKGIFRIKDTKSERIYRFRYDPKEQALYLLKDGREVQVNNAGSALYAFAAQKSYFELLIRNPSMGIRPIYFLENIVILEN